MDKIEKIAKKVIALDPELEEHHYNMDSENPAVYVGTYGKYAGGSIDGMWVDLTTFDSYDEFYEWCSKVLHKDESEPELMFQDYENFPEAYYSESGLKPELWDYMEALDECDKDVIDAILDEGYTLEDAKNAIVYPDCDDMSDVAYAMVDECGEEAFSKNAWETAFDYERYGREYQWDLDSDDREQYDGMSDLEVGEQVVEEFGGLDGLGDETIKAYANFKTLGDWLQSGGEWVKYDGGYAEIVQ